MQTQHMRATGRAAVTARAAPAVPGAGPGVPAARRAGPPPGGAAAVRAAAPAGAAAPAAPAAPAARRAAPPPGGAPVRVAVPAGAAAPAVPAAQGVEVRRPEILAPAGGWPQLRAAVENVRMALLFMSGWHVLCRKQGGGKSHGGRLPEGEERDGEGRGWSRGLGWEGLREGGGKRDKGGGGRDKVRESVDALNGQRLHPWKEV
jgi:hypothetical protein